jgi:hypothetical protein
MARRLAPERTPNLKQLRVEDTLNASTGRRSLLPRAVGPRPCSAIGVVFASTMKSLLETGVAPPQAAAIARAAHRRARLVVL